MLYVVSRKCPKGKEMSLDQLLSGKECNSAHRERNYPGTVTRCCDAMPSGLYTAEDIQRFISNLENIIPLIRYTPREYREFTIPKRSGGRRKICAPCGDLDNAQIIFREYLESGPGALYHTAAFAYCKERSTLLCMKRHQANKSNWFLKIDFSDFFGNTNKDFVISKLSQIVPYNMILSHPKGREMFLEALDICFKDGGLPQGTTTSPMLTNLAMIPFDHELSKRLHKQGFVYTRYADDMQISHQKKFDPEKVQEIIKSVLSDLDMPFHIKDEKTRFGSCAGRNWNLGLMLNKDNKITIGHKTHKLMKARVHAFLMDEKNKRPWSKHDVEILAGQIAYMKSIEPQTVQYITTHLSHKVGLQFDKIISKRLKMENTHNNLNVFTPRRSSGNVIRNANDFDTVPDFDAFVPFF